MFAQFEQALANNLYNMAGCVGPQCTEDVILFFLFRFELTSQVAA
jgi:hypothetical protein